MANQKIDFKQKSDRFHVMLNEATDAIINYRQQITVIDQNLRAAESSLVNIPGVDAALSGITASKQENYERLRKVQQAEKAENELFMVIGQQYTLLQQAVAELTPPQAAQQNPQLPMNETQDVNPN